MAVTSSFTDQSEDDAAEAQAAQAREQGTDLIREHLRGHLDQNPSSSFVVRFVGTTRWLLCVIVSNNLTFFFSPSLDLDCYTSSRECHCHDWSSLSHSRQSMEDCLWRNKVWSLRKSSRWSHSYWCSGHSTAEALLCRFPRLYCGTCHGHFGSINHFFTRSVRPFCSQCSSWIRVHLPSLLRLYVVQIHYWTTLLDTLEMLLVFEQDISIH